MRDLNIITMLNIIIIKHKTIIVHLKHIFYGSIYIYVDAMGCKKKKYESFRHNISTQTQIININFLFIKLKTSITKLFLSFYKYIFFYAKYSCIAVGYKKFTRVLNIIF